MRSKIVPVSNVIALSEAGEALLSRAPGMPGMGAAFGPSGYGKSTSMAWLATRQNAVFVRARAVDTPRSLLESIARELHIAPHHRIAQAVDAIVSKFAETQRPLFIDEADYIVGKQVLIDTMRDLHDLSSVPVVLIGMKGFDRRISASPQLHGRMAQWVEFKPATIEDAKKLARELCEVEVADDLVAELHKRSAGEVRLFVVGLGRIELFARSRSQSRIALADWPREADFFMGGALRVAKRLQAV